MLGSIREKVLITWNLVVNSRTCDYPAVVSTSGSLAQCCGNGIECVFWSSCSVATLFAQSILLFCDQGTCNTGVLVPTVGASEGVSYLRCWPLNFETAAFTMVMDIGSGTFITTPSLDLDLVLDSLALLHRLLLPSSLSCD